MDTITLFGGVVWSGRGLISPAAALSAGVDARRYLSGPESLETLWTPFASLQVGARLRLGDAIAIEGGVLGQIDLSKTLIQLGDADPVPLFPAEVAGTLGLRFAPR